MSAVLFQCPAMTAFADDRHRSTGSTFLHLRHAAGSFAIPDAA